LGAVTFWHSAFCVEEVVLACWAALRAALGLAALEVVLLSLPPQPAASHDHRGEQQDGESGQASHGGQG
jgi:hypothetical protein